MPSYMKYSLPELEDIINDIYSWDLISIKINEIYNAANVLSETIHPKTPQTVDVNKKSRRIKEMCDEIDKNISDHFKNMGIYEENMDDVAEDIKKCIKIKVINELRCDMITNEDAYKNMPDYVEDYFQNYNVCRKSDDLLTCIKDWILFIQSQNVNQEN